jgi:Ca2+/Na+ antiporter
MTALGTDPLTLGHTAISLAAIIAGLMALAAMLKGQSPVRLTGVFLALTVLTSLTGYLFHNDHLTPAQITGAVSLAVLAVALFAFYGRHLAGRWRAAYVVTAVAALYLNVFVLVIQSFIKIPALHALAPAIPPAGPVFGAVQGLVLIAFLVTGWMAVRAGRGPI